MSKLNETKKSWEHLKRLVREELKRNAHPEFKKIIIRKNNVVFITHDGQQFKVRPKIERAGGK